MKKVVNNIRKGIVLALFVASILVIFAETNNLLVLAVSKTIALTYFYMFLRANKVID